VCNYSLQFDNETKLRYACTKKQQNHHLRKPIEQNKNEIFSLFMFYIQHMLLPDEEKVIGVFLNDLAIINFFHLVTSAPGLYRLAI